MCYIHTMEHDSAIKTNNTCYNMDEPQKCYAKWKGPDTKDYILWSSLYEISRKGRFIEIESRSGFAYGWGIGTEIYCHSCFSGDGNVLKFECDDGCTTL